MMRNSIRVCAVCYLRRNQSSRKEIYQNLEQKYTCGPLEYKMDTAMLIVSTCMGNFIRMIRDKRTLVAR